MKDPRGRKGNLLLKHIILSTGEAAIVVNGVVVEVVEGVTPAYVEQVAEKLAEALVEPLQRVSLPAPADPDWTWEDIEAGLYAQVPKSFEDRKLELLEVIGFVFKQDLDVPDGWLWTNPAGDSERDFISKAQAVAGAWADAVSHAKAILELDDVAWNESSNNQQLVLVRKALAGN